MADVRLTATNPEDSSVVPVACNAKGELLLEEPTLASDDYVAVTGDNMTGDLTLGRDKITLDATDGNATFASGGRFNAYLISPYIISSTASGNATYVGKNATADTDEIQYVSGVGINIGTNLLSEDSTNIKLSTNGAASFAGDVIIGNNPTGSITTSGIRAANYGALLARADNTNVFAGYQNGVTTPTSSIRSTGEAFFAGDVIVSSRYKQWMLVEQNGLCHMVEQMRASTADLVEPTADLVDPYPVAAEYPPLRDVFAELDAIEKALGEVMERLRMSPPAGWEVWDGSNEGTDRP